MEIHSRNEGGVEIFSLSGRITILAGADLFRGRFKCSLAEGHRHFVFDLRDLRFMDSASIGEMVACLKRAREQSGSVKLLISPGGTIDDLVRLSAMDRIFEVYYDEAEAGLSSRPRA